MSDAQDSSLGATSRTITYRPPRSMVPALSSELSASAGATGGAVRVAVRRRGAADEVEGVPPEGPRPLGEDADVLVVRVEDVGPVRGAVHVGAEERVSAVRRGHHPDVLAVRRPVVGAVRLELAGEARVVRQ